MSIESEIARIETAKADLKDSINAKGGTITDETLDEYASAITSLPSGSLTIEGQQIITGILTGTVDAFDTVYSKLISDGNWDTVQNKLSDPAVLPTGTGKGVAFSNDGTYLAIAHTTSPRLTIYKRSGDTFTKLAITAPAGNGYDVTFSNDGTYLAVAHDTTPYITVYKRSNDTFSKLSTSKVPALTGGGRSVSFSGWGYYLAVGYVSGLTIYSRSGDTFTKLANLSPGGNVQGVSFSNGDTYLAVAHTSSPYLTVYKHSGDRFDKLTTVDALSGGSGVGVAFSSDAVYLAVAHNGSPYITVYKRNGDTFTKLSVTKVPALPTNNNGQGVSFSSDNIYLAITHDGSPYLTIYSRSGDTFTKLDLDIEALPGPSKGVSFSSDGSYLAVAHDTSPYLTVYTTHYIKISPALNTIPLEYDDVGYASEGGVENDEIEMISIFR